MKAHYKQEFEFIIFDGTNFDEIEDFNLDLKFETRQADEDGFYKLYSENNYNYSYVEIGYYIFNKFFLIGEDLEVSISPEEFKKYFEIIEN